MEKFNIKVLGGGCSKCETLLANSKAAVAAAGVEADIEYITDFAVIGFLRHHAHPGPDGKQ